MENRKKVIMLSNRFATVLANLSNLKIDEKILLLDLEETDISSLVGSIRKNRPKAIVIDSAISEEAFKNHFSEASMAIGIFEIDAFFYVYGEEPGISGVVRLNDLNKLADLVAKIYT